MRPGLWALPSLLNVVLLLMLMKIRSCERMWLAQGHGAGWGQKQGLDPDLLSTSTRYHTVYNSVGQDASGCR